MHGKGEVGLLLWLQRVSPRHAGGSNGAPQRAEAATWGTINSYLAETFVFLSFFYPFVISCVFVTLAAQ
jgi:hypothetical protein